MKSINCIYSLPETLTNPIIREADGGGVILLLFGKALSSLILNCIILQIEDPDIRIKQVSPDQCVALYPNKGLILRFGQGNILMQPSEGGLFSQYMSSDQYHYRLNCSLCRKSLRPLFPQSVSSTSYICPLCGGKITSVTWNEMLEEGKWHQDVKGTNGIKSYYINSLMNQGNTAADFFPIIPDFNREHVGIY